MNNVFLGIKGFLGTSLIDFPGKVAAVVFLQGCNLKCAFCHNSLLVEDNQELEDLQLQELMDALIRRRKILDGVVVTGGEPTVHPQLSQLLRSLRTTGLAIKLDTNGMQSISLAGIIGEGLVDYVAVDMKVAPERYPSAVKAPADAAQRLGATVALLKSSGVEYEFRTTCVPGLTFDEDILAIARLIEGAPAYYLQQYRPTYVRDPELASRPPFPREVLERFAEIAQPYVQSVGLRNL